MIEVSQTYYHRCYENNRTVILGLKEKQSDNSDITATSNHYFLFLFIPRSERGVVAKDP